MKCENCGKDLKYTEAAWLELSQTHGRYYQEIPKGHESQGAFPFGKACAKKVVRNHGRLKDF